MKLNDYIDCERLDKDIDEYSNKYQLAHPFPNIVIDNFFKKDSIHNTLKGYEKVDWTSFRHFNEKKSGNKNTKFDASLKNTIEVLNSSEFIEKLEKITGIKNLIADSELGSGGVHRSTRGGFLNIHADFTVHPYNKNWHRRVNLLVYLNEKWNDSWGGHLELWDKNMKKCEKKISPIFNRCVIFNTDYDSYHGHPEPMKCPNNVYRKSIALYYYTLIDSKVRTVSTNYKSRPNDKSIKKILIFLDKLLLSFFHYLKSRFKISDRFITRIFYLFN